jgi:hypothetical protein
VVQVFVNQHDFFIVREKLESQDPMQWTSDLYFDLRNLQLITDWKNCPIQMLNPLVLNQVLSIFATKSEPS